MSEVIERAAAALRATDRAAAPEGLVTKSEIDDFYRRAARAALQSIREPSEVMKDAFYDKQAECDDGLGGAINAADAWQVMLDAAIAIGREE